MTWSPVGTSPFLFSLPLRPLLRLFRQALVGCSLFFLLVYVSGVFSLPFLFLPGLGLPSLLVGVIPFIFSPFFFSFGLPNLFVAFSISCPFPSCRFLHGVLCGFLPWLGISSFRVSLPSSLCLFSFGPFGFRPSYIGSGLFLWAFLPLPCAYYPYCLFRPWAFPSLPRYWFISPRSPSSLFLSAWCFLCFLGGFSSGFSSVSSSGVSLLSFYHSVVLPLRLTRFHSLSPFAFVPPMVCGDISHVFLFCLFLRFGFPSCFL